MDEEGNAFYINSGEGYPTGNQGDGKYVSNDLWKLDLASNTWTVIIPQDGAPNPTIGAGMDIVPYRNSVYRFGGSHGAGSPDYLTALESVDLLATTPAWAAVTTLGETPSPRNSAGVYFDSPRRRLIVVGGYLLGGATKLDVHALTFR